MNITYWILRVDKTKMGSALFLLFLSGFLGGCGEPFVEIGFSTPPAAPSTLSEAIDYLTGYSAEKRIVAALAIPSFGEEAIIALPYLIQNLYYEINHEVRRSAAIAIGLLGPDAHTAVPALLEVAANENETIQVRRSAATALGQIGDISAIPILASLLSTEDSGIRIESALAISKITGEDFPDTAPQSGYRLNEAGEALIVIAAQEWWKKEGIFDDWTE